MERSCIPLWDGVEGQRLTTVEMIEKMARIADEPGRPIATAAEARRIKKSAPRTTCNRSPSSISGCRRVPKRATVASSPTPVDGSRHRLRQHRRPIRGTCSDAGVAPSRKDHR